MKKVLHILDYMGTGGVESFLINLTKAQSRNFHVCVLTLRENNTYSSEDFEESNVKFKSLSMKSSLNILGLLKLRKYVATERPDIIHLHLFPSQMIVPYILYGMNCNIITTEHGISFRRANHFYMKLIEFYSYKSFKKISCVSGAVRDFLLLDYKSLGDSMCVIENGVNVEKFRNATGIAKSELSMKFCDDDFILCMVGRLEIGKDFETIIKSLKKLPICCKLLIVGEGVKRKLLVEMVGDLGLQDRVDFYGFTKEIEVIYKSVDLFVLSSEREGLPMVLLEAMSAGIPCIGSNVDGIKQLIDRLDLLFNYGDVDCLSNLILKIHSDRDFYSMAKSVSETISEEHSFSKMHSRYNLLYSDLGVV